MTLERVGALCSIIGVVVGAIGAWLAYKAMRAAMSAEKAAANARAAMRRLAVARGIPEARRLLEQAVGLLVHRRKHEVHPLLVSAAEVLTRAKRYAPEALGASMAQVERVEKSLWQMVALLAGFEADIPENEAKKMSEQLAGMVKLITEVEAECQRNVEDW